MKFFDKLGKLGLEASTSNSFEGKGTAGNENQFAGTITVTVVEVLPNGNLVVSGEKQVGINQGVETLKFAGVVDPLTIMPGNTVSSTQVADARMQVLRCCRLPVLGVRSCWRAHGVLEMRCGEIARLGIRPGMQLQLDEVADIFCGMPEAARPAL